RQGLLAQSPKLPSQRGHDHRLVPRPGPDPPGRPSPCVTNFRKPPWYVERMPGGVGGGNREEPAYPIRKTEDRGAKSIDRSSRRAAKHLCPRTPSGRAAAALPAEPAGLAGYDRDPHSLRHGGLLFAPALQPRLPHGAAADLVRELHQLPERSGLLAHPQDLAALYRPGGRHPAGAGSRHRAPVAAPDLVQRHHEPAADPAADGGASDRQPD